jgi:hypothetical protein
MRRALEVAQLEDVGIVGRRQYGGYAVVRFVPVLLCIILRGKIPMRAVWLVIFL